MDFVKSLFNRSWIFFIAVALYVPGAVSDEKILMSEVNKYLSYISGPSAPEVLRKGAMRLGSIHSKCYGEATVDQCQSALRDAGDLDSVTFLNSFEEYYPKLKEFKDMVDLVESGRLDPYEPSSHIIFLDRNCSANSECYEVAQAYMATIERVNSVCAMTRRSNMAQFTVGKIWDCFKPINDVVKLEKKAKDFRPPVNEIGRTALERIENSEANAVLDMLKDKNVFEKCGKKSELVDDAICSNSKFMNLYVNLLRSSIENRGVSEKGEIDISRNEIYSITNDYDDLSPGSAGDKYKNFLTVEFDKIFSAIDRDGKELKEFLVKRLDDLSRRYAKVQEVKDKQAKHKERIKTAADRLAARLGEDGLIFHDGSVTDIYRWLQEGDLSPKRVKDYVISSDRSGLVLGNVDGSSLRFLSADDWSYQVAMSKRFANQVVVNGSISSICGCSFFRITETDVFQDENGRLIQIFSVVPYENEHTREVQAVRNDD